MPVHDATENELHRVALKVVDGEGVEVAEEPRGDGVAPASRGTHGCYQYNVHQVHLRSVWRNMFRVRVEERCACETLQIMAGVSTKEEEWGRDRTVEISGVSKPTPTPH